MKYLVNVQNNKMGFKWVFELSFNGHTLLMQSHNFKDKNKMHSKNKIEVIDNLYTSCCLISFGPLCVISILEFKSPPYYYIWTHVTFTWCMNWFCMLRNILTHKQVTFSWKTIVELRTYSINTRCALDSCVLHRFCIKIDLHL